MDKIISHKGSCHCGAVRFEADAPAHIEATSCTCSICDMTGFLHLFVAKDQFRITEGESNLSEYRFNTGVAKHLFCRTCGVKAFYVPRSHPDGWSVNVHCLDKAMVTDVSVGAFDGANWEDNIASLT